MDNSGTGDIVQAVEPLANRAQYLAIGFLEGFACGMRLYSSADREAVAAEIREAAIELRELLHDAPPSDPGKPAKGNS